MKNLISYIKNVVGEMKHVVWPSTREGIAHTLLIIGLSVAIGLFIALLDHMFATGLNLIINR